MRNSIAALALVLALSPLGAQDAPQASPAPDAQTAASEQVDPAPSAAPDAVAPDASAPAVAAPDAVAAATIIGAPSASFNEPRLLGGIVPIGSHTFTGFASGGLLAAAGIVGGVRFLEMEWNAHEVRNSLGIDDEDAIDARCAAIIRNTWAADQWMRWLHVGLLASGESLYLYDALTGLSMMKAGAADLSAGRIHRYAFFIHGGLMVAEIVLGFLTTDALSRGEHQLVRAFAAAHTGIGIAIPILIIGAGVALESTRPKLLPKAAKGASRPAAVAFLKPHQADSIQLVGIEDSFPMQGHELLADR
jgi:hypothetical protein